MSDSGKKYQRVPVYRDDTKKKKTKDIMTFGESNAYWLSIGLGSVSTLMFAPLAPLAMVLIDKSEGTKDLSSNKKWIIWTVAGVVSWFPLVGLIGVLIPGPDPVEVASEEVVETVQEVIGLAPTPVVETPTPPIASTPEPEPVFYSDSDTRNQYATTYGKYRSMGYGHGEAADKTRGYLTSNGFDYDALGNVNRTFRLGVKECYEGMGDPFCGRNSY